MQSNKYWNVPCAIELAEQTTMKFRLASLRFPPPDMKTEYEYIDYVLLVLGETITTPVEVLPNLLDKSSAGLVKSAVKSKNLRNEGNALFGRGKLDESSALYTCSISYADTGSRELALAYGNRSAILFQKKFYSECMEDINRAFENNYPQDKKAKLLIRQARAKEVLHTQINQPYHGEVPKIRNRNPGMPDASNCLKIGNNKEFGRHIIAARDIGPGQLLLVEKPYAQFVPLGNYDKYFLCSECLEWCYNLIPCEKCSGALYCSKTCRRKAFVDYHRYECVIRRHFGYDLIDWVATKMTLKGTKEYGTTDVNGAYKKLSSLFTDGDEVHFVTRNKNNADAFTQAAGVAKVFYILKNHTDFFLEFDIDDKENALKRLLLRDLRISVFNSREVQTRHLEDVPVSVGMAIYYTFSLFNHACIENVMSSFYGSTVVLKAKKMIKQGEQCFINYGVDPTVIGTIHRQRILEEDFQFSCKCQACVQHWPRVEKPNSASKRLIATLEEIIAEASASIQIDQARKNTLLQKTFSAAHELQDKVPCLAYELTNNVFNRLLWDGNDITYFEPMKDFSDSILAIILNNLMGAGLS